MSVVDQEMLEQLKEQPHQLAWYHNPEAEISDLIHEIRDRTGISYDDLGTMLGIGRDHLGRIARGEFTRLTPSTASSIAREFNLPFTKVVYSAAIHSLPPDERDELRQSDREYRAHAARPNGDLTRGYLKRIHLSSELLGTELSPEEIAEILPSAAAWVDHDRVLPPPQDPDRTIYVEMDGVHMTPRYRPGEITPPRDPIRHGIIPDRSIVEVWLARRSEVCSGDIVLVQVGMHHANFFRIATGGKLGRNEVYHVLNRSAVGHVVEHAPHRGLYPEQQRIIIGVAQRIVDFDLTTHAIRRGQD